MGYKSLKNPCNTVFKQQVVASLYHDIFIFSETHCRKDETIEFDNYVIYSNNRTVNANSKKGSGGISIALHESIVNSHTILSVVRGVDGQLSLKMKCNFTYQKIGILCLYLSPDTYKYGQDSEEFFSQASSLWDDLSDCDLILGGGDINARTKNMIDFIPEIDGQNIPPRTNPDTSKNAHADSFITFLKDIRAVILNGRITPQFNDYTFVSSRGCSVPDYIFCSLDNLKNCVSMKTHLISDVINKYNMFPPKSLPDHSILSGKFETSFYTSFRGKNQLFLSICTVM